MPVADRVGLALDQPDPSDPPFMRESGVVASSHVVAGAQGSPAHWCLARSLPVPVVCSPARCAGEPAGADEVAL